MLAIITKELRNIKENLPFNAATILSPLLFLFAFTVMVSGGITLPAGNTPPVTQSAFLQSTSDFRAPDGTPYLALHPAAPNLDRYDVVVEPHIEPSGISGQINHVITDVNANMTKNYANRLTGAVVDYIDRHVRAGTVSVTETTRYPTDIPWDASFAVNTLIFGAMLAGFLFGQLAMTSEWENRTTALLALAPRSPASLAGGKIVAAFVKAVVAGGALVGVVALLTPIPIPHPWVLAGTVALMCATFAAVGLILGLAVRSTMTAFLLALVFSLSLWVAGGGFGDLSYFGATTQLIGGLNPATYALDAARYSYFGGILNPLALPLLALGTCVLLIAAIAAFSRWTLCEKVTS
ncbi:ABC transporter permease [Trueperella pyogenes]|uniref:ABC transporter permease n=1 Tax=Trueperella pyogenes TaxID=1661 RepID=UPI00312BA43A